MANVGDLVRLARNFRGFTQKKASIKLSIAQAVFSRIENGLVEPDEEFIRNAARAFNLPVEFFQISDTVYGPPVSVHAMLRGKSSEVTARDVDMITAELNIRLMHIRRFQENVDYDPPNEIPIMDVEQYGSINKIANTVRAHWKIVDGPIRNLTQIMERAGIIIGLSDFHGASISGVTFSAPGRAPIVLVNRHHPADRLRFTLAHELGHLVLHRFPTSDMENEANQFASSFLLPPSELKQVFRGRKITLALLASLKKEWRVSMQSLLMSASATNSVTKNQARYLWQQISSKGWRTREPASLDFEFDAPTVLPTMIRAHLDDLGFDLTELLKLSRVNEDDFEHFYGEFVDKEVNTRPRLRIVS